MTDAPEDAARGRAKWLFYKQQGYVLRAHDLAREVRSAREKLGLTVLVAEQSIAYARQCTEYVYLLDSGALVFAGDWAAFDANPELKTRYLAV